MCSDAGSPRGQVGRGNVSDECSRGAGGGGGMPTCSCTHCPFDAYHTGRVKDSRLAYLVHRVELGGGWVEFNADPVEIGQADALSRRHLPHPEPEAVVLEPGQRLHAVLHKLGPLLVVAERLGVPRRVLIVQERFHVGFSEKCVEHKAAEGAASLGCLDQVRDAQHPHRLQVVRRCAFVFWVAEGKEEDGQDSCYRCARRASGLPDIIVLVFFLIRRRLGRDGLECGEGVPRVKKFCLGETLGAVIEIRTVVAPVSGFMIAAGSTAAIAGIPELWFGLVGQ